MASSRSEACDLWDNLQASGLRLWLRDGDAPFFGFWTKPLHQRWVEGFVLLSSRCQLHFKLCARCGCCCEGSKRLHPPFITTKGTKRTTLCAKMSDYGADSVSLSMTRTSSDISESSEELRGREGGDSTCFRTRPSTA